MFFVHMEKRFCQRRIICTEREKKDRERYDEKEAFPIPCSSLMPY